MKKILYNLLCFSILSLGLLFPTTFAMAGNGTPTAAAGAGSPACQTNPSSTACAQARRFSCPNGQIQVGFSCQDAAGHPVGAATQPPPSPGIWCSTTGFCPSQWINDIELWLGNLFLWIGGVVVYMAAFLLNLAIVHTILNMKVMLDSISGITIAWGALRNVANIAFIFILIWIAVSTILSLSTGASYRKLTTVIIVALLINFSLFFTKVIVDVSNVVTLQFYYAMDPGGTQTKLDGSYGLGNRLIQELSLLSIFDQKGAAERQATAGAGSSGGQSSTQNLNGGKVLMYGIMGSIFFFIAAFVFFIAAILLLVRFAVIVILLVTSPLAYVGMLLPQSMSYAKKWWAALWDQVIFAPAFMMLVWVVLAIITDPKFKAVLYANQPTAANGTSQAGLVDAISNGPVVVVLQFGIVIVLMMAALIIAKQLGSYGGATMIKLGSQAVFGGAGWLGRQSAGRIFNGVANSKALQNRAANGGLLGRNFARATQGVARAGASSSFDARALPGAKTLAGIGGIGGSFVPSGKGGFATAQAEKDKRRQARANEIEKNIDFGKPSASEKAAIDAQKAAVQQAEQAVQAAYASNAPGAQIQVAESTLKTQKAALKALTTKNSNAFIAKHNPKSLIGKGRKGSVYQLVAARLRIKELDGTIKDREGEIKDNEKEIKKIQTDANKNTNGVIAQSGKSAIANYMAENIQKKSTLDTLKQELEGLKKLVQEEKK